MGCSCSSTLTRANTRSQTRNKHNVLRDRPPRRQIRVTETHLFAFWMASCASFLRGHATFVGQEAVARGAIPPIGPFMVLFGIALASLYMTEPCKNQLLWAMGIGRSRPGNQRRYHAARMNEVVTKNARRPA